MAAIQNKGRNDTNTEARTTPNAEKAMNNMNLPEIDARPKDH